jgi:hypothetical protein
VDSRLHKNSSASDLALTTTHILCRLYQRSSAGISWLGCSAFGLFMYIFASHQIISFSSSDDVHPTSSSPRTQMPRRSVSPPSAVLALLAHAPSSSYLLHIPLVLSQHWRHCLRFSGDTSRFSLINASSEGTACCDSWPFSGQHLAFAGGCTSH